MPQETRFEEGWAPSILTSLARDYGHPLRDPESGGFGSVQAIVVGEDGTVDALSDPRRGGSAGIQGRGVMRPAPIR